MRPSPACKAPTRLATVLAGAPYAIALDGRSVYFGVQTVGGGGLVLRVAKP